MRRATIALFLLVLAAFPMGATYSPPSGARPSPSLLFVDGPMAGVEVAQPLALIGAAAIAWLVAPNRLPRV